MTTLSSHLTAIRLHHYALKTAKCCGRRPICLITLVITCTLVITLFITLVITLVITLRRECNTSVMSYT